MPGEIEVDFFGEKPEAIGRRFFGDVRSARAWAESVLKMGLEVYCCVLYEKHSLFEQLYFNRRKEIIHLREPWALTREQARGLYLENGRVRGLPERYLIYGEEQ